MMSWIKLVIPDEFYDTARRAFRTLFPPKQTEWQIRTARDQERLNRILPELINKNSNCIDIGAHKGSYIDLFLRHAPSGKHWGFEPLPELYLELKDKYPEVDMNPVALSDSTGTTIFNMVPDALAWSGLKPQEYPAGYEIREIEVQTDLLDNIIPDHQKIDFIKIDVEGAELAVLKGGRRLIAEYRPAILFEHALIHNKGYNITPEEVFDFFEGVGMEIYKCDLSYKFNKKRFIDTYFSSYRTNYNRDAETNFIALGKKD